MARASATTRELISRSMRAGHSTRRAASPAGRTRTSSMRSLRVGRSRLERREQLLMDAVEAAVRHDDDQAALPRVARHRLDDVVDARDVARLHAGLAQVGVEARY